MLKDGNWRYINGSAEGKKYGQLQCFSVDDMSKSGHHGVNCSGFCSLVLQKAGVLGKGKAIYSYTSEADAKAHKRTGRNSPWTDIKKNCKVIDYNGVIAGSVVLKAGDICMWLNHCNIYLGNNQWYDAGSNMTATGKHGGIFKNFTKKQDRSKIKLYTVIRIN